MKTGFLYDKRFLDHDTGSHHPESKERLSVTHAHLKQRPWYENLIQIKTKTADPVWLETVHETEYIRRAQAACRKGNSILDTPDVPISDKSYDIALLAAGGALELADQILSQKIQNGFALLRPPGHHAEKNFAMGFCLFNNAAITARYLQKRHNLERILILDWDAHHGNGTQHFFEQDASVLYVSLHQYPFYPGTGSGWETGEGKGEGATLNCPMKAGATDEDYREAFKSKIGPKVNEFKPDAVVISAGFDAHARDPLAQICLTSDSYTWMTERVMEWADKYSRGRILSLLEGGYDLKALPECVEKHLAVLSHSIG